MKSKIINRVRKQKLQVFLNRTDQELAELRFERRIELLESADKHMVLIKEALKPGSVLPISNKIVRHWWQFWK